MPIIFGVVGFLAIGGTIAYNQSTHIFDNLFHVDEVSHIDFVETFDSPQDWQPCQEIPKTAIARNEAGVTVNLRLKYDEYWLSEQGEDMPLQKDGDSIAIINFQNQADWELKSDGWYYYKHQLAPGDESNSYFRSVTMNCGMNMSKELKYCENDDGTDCDKDISEYSEATYHIFIRMQTYQGDPPAEQYNVSIDPNGGTFDDSDEVYTARVDAGTEIDLSDIERDGYNFTNWTLNGSDSYTDSTITINGNTTLVANWEQSGPQVARIERTGRIYPSIMSAHNAAQTNDVITLLVDTEEVVTNEKTVTLNLDDHTVTGSLTNTATGNLTVLDGEINNPNGVAVTNNGTLTIGVNDYDDQNAAIVINDYVRFIGTTVGLDQNGTFNYYDGYLEGVIGLDGGYDDTPFYHQTGEIGDIHYHPLVSYIEVRDIHHVELSANDNAVSKTIVGGEVFYYDLQDNINVSAETGYQIYAVRDFDAAYTITVPENTAIVFDIAGYNVVFKNVATNNGDFTILNSSTTSGSLKTEQTMDNEGDLTIRDMTIVSANANTTLKNGGKLILRNAIVTNSSTSYALETKSGGTYDLDASSAIEGNRNGPKAIYNDTADFEWTNGTIYGNILNSSSATATISGGTIDTTANKGWESCAIDGGTIVINQGATINAKRSFACNAEVTINGGTITAGPLSGAAVDNSSSSKNVYINGGTITINGMGGSAFSFGKNVTQTGGDVSVISSTTGKGTVGYTQIVNMSGGTLYVENNGNYSNVSTAQGIQAIGGEISGGTITVVNKKKLPATGVSATKISGGTINVTSNTGTAIGIQNTATITGGTVTANTNSGTAYGISNTSGTSNVSGATITAIAHTTGTAAGINASSNVNITSGTYEGTTYGILTSGGTTTLGENEGGVPSKTSPEIIGGNLGVSGSSIRFFDGIIKGGAYAIGEGAISAIPDGYTYHKETIDEKENCWLEVMADFLEVNGDTYSSFEDAYNAITDSTGTIKVIDDVTLEAAIPNSPSGKTVTIDLNGHKLTNTQPIKTDGAIILTDSSQGKTGELTNNNTSAITGTGSISVISTKVTGKITSSVRGGAVVIDDSTINGFVQYTGGYGSMTINDSQITGTNNVVYCSNSSSTLTIGGNTKIYSENQDIAATVALYTECNTTIKDTADVSAVSNLQSNGNVFAVHSKGDLTVKDSATISAMTAKNNLYTDGIYSESGTINLQGGTIMSRDDESTNVKSYAIRSSGASISISAGAVITAEGFSGDVAGIYAKYPRAFSMTGGQITAHGDYSTTRGIYFDYGTSGVSPVISGGTINAYSDRGLTSYGIHAYNYSSNNSVIIEGGTINGKKYGIFTDYAPIVLGNNSDGVSITNPAITGGEYALHNNDSGSGFSFYDGILKGGTEAYYPNSITSIPDGYTYHEEIIDGKENCWLVEAGGYLEVDGVTYNSLGNAYDAITGNSGTITVVQDAAVQAVHPDSPEGKTITLDLNGHTLSYSQPIINKSTMIIQDSSQAKTGAIISTGSSVPAIKNYTNLTINSGSYSSSYYTIQDVYGSTMTMNGGTITSTLAGVYCLDGDWSNTTTIHLNYGTITADSTTGNALAVYCGNGMIDINNDFSVVATTTAGNATGVYTDETITIEDDATISSTTQSTSSSSSALAAQANSLSISDNVAITSNARNGSARGVSAYNLSISSGTVTASSLYGNSTAASGSGSITGGTISADSQYNGESVGLSFGNGTISGGTITAQSVNKAAKAVSASSGTTIQGGTITATTTAGTSYGVFGSGYTITDGTITGMYGALSQTSATANIGSNDGTLDRTKPIITGSAYALSGAFNFYDGTLKGEIAAFESDTIKTIADDSSLHLDTVTEGGITYQECYLVAGYDVAQIGGSAGTRYRTLQAAVNAALEDDVIDIIGENYMFYELNIPADKVITIDMHGYETWTNYKITNSGKVGIINSAYEIDPSTITLNGGLVEITNAADAELAVHNVNVESDYIAFRNSGTLNINGVNAITKSYPLNNKGSGTATVNNSTLSGTAGVYSENGTVNVQNSTIKGTIAVHNGQTTIKDSISEPKDADTNNSIFLYGTSELVFDNVQHTSRYYNHVSRSSTNEYTINTVSANTSFTAKNSSLTLIPLRDTNVYIDYFTNNGTINIDNSTIVLDSSELTTGGGQIKMIQNASTVNFPSGEITATYNGTVYGIFNTNTGTITMGVPDDNPDTHGTDHADVSTTNPAISANLNNAPSGGIGIQNNSGVINFYDGRVSGRNTAISSGATQTEYMYELREYTDENNNKYMILVWTPNS